MLLNNIIIERMNRAKAIQTLKKLKNKIYQDDFRLSNWKAEACNIIERLFIDSKDEKKEQINGVHLNPLLSSLYNGEDLELKKNEDLEYTKTKADNLISAYIQLIGDFDLEENNITRKMRQQINKLNLKIRSLETQNKELEIRIPKTFWEKNKNDWGFWGVILTILTVLGTTSYFVGNHFGVTKYEKSKYDLEVKIDTLTKQNLKLMKQNKDLKNLINKQEIKITKPQN
jgi:chaperonin cofactor prefoldin